MNIKKNHFKIIILFLSFFMIVFNNVNTIQAEEYYVRDYEWYYGGYQWTWVLNINKSSYESYTKVGLNQRFLYGYNCWDFLITTEDLLIIEMASALHDASENQGYSPYEEVSFILAFVQCLPYTSDRVTTSYDDYPRFPLETLVDEGGDCEDTSILFATLMLILDYDVVFFNPPGHLAVGIWGKSGIGGTSVEYYGKDYYYCETTGSGFSIGDLPSDFEGKSITIIPINEERQFQILEGFSWFFAYIPGSIIICVVSSILIFHYKKYSRDPLY